MAITLEEATEATDAALQQCIDEVNTDPSISEKEKERLIDIMLDTREKSIATLMDMSAEDEARLRKYQRRKAETITAVIIKR